jgi:hypothetical protein
MDAQITFDKNKFSDLFEIAAQITAFGKGQIDSLSLQDIQTAMSELKRVERTCEEIELVAA